MERITEVYAWVVDDAAAVGKRGHEAIAVNGIVLISDHRPSAEAMALGAQQLSDMARTPVRLYQFTNRRELAVVTPRDGRKPS